MIADPCVHPGELDAVCAGAEKPLAPPIDEPGKAAEHRASVAPNGKLGVGRDVARGAAPTRALGSFDGIERAGAGWLRNTFGCVPRRHRFHVATISSRRHADRLSFGRQPDHGDDATKVLADDAHFAAN